MARPGVVQEKVYVQLVKRILSNKTAPGTRLIERDLASDLGVSRIPVRAALAKLVSQGLLKGGQNGQGVWVRQYSAIEIRDLYFYRSVIEGGIVRLVASKADSNDLLMAKICCEQMGSLIEQLNFDKWGKLDHKFHICLAEASGNERLINANKMLLSECDYLFYQYSKKMGLLPMAEQEAEQKKYILSEHRKLLELISEGKGDEAECMVRDTMAQSADRLCKLVIMSELNEKHSNR